MTNAEELSLTISQTVNAPIEKVFDLWLNPETLSIIMRPQPGMPQPKVELNPVIGEKFTINMDVGDQVIPHTGEYIIIDRPNQIDFTWESPFSADGSRVRLTFKSTEGNATSVTLTQNRFIDEEHQNNHKGGWGQILSLMEEAV